MLDRRSDLLSAICYLLSAICKVLSSPDLDHHEFLRIPWLRLDRDETARVQGEYCAHPRSRTNPGPAATASPSEEELRLKINELQVTRNESITDEVATVGYSAMIEALKLVLRAD